MTSRESRSRAADLVICDLVDTIVQEQLFSVAERAQPDPASAVDGESLALGEQWCRLDLTGGRLCFRIRPVAALQPWRLARAPVWHTTADGGPARPLAPAELLRLLVDDSGVEFAGAEAVLADLAAAVEHAALTLDAHRALDERRPTPGALPGRWLLAGERLAATRGRPFHPTARTVSGWTVGDLSRYGPMRAQPLALDWVAVRREHLLHGGDPASHRLHELLLDTAEQQRLSDLMHRAGLTAAEFQPVPVHPWQFEHVLPREFADEFGSGDVVRLGRGLGRCHPTASLRTLACASDSARHVKLPLGVATLGAVRLLPPRYLDNGDRAQRTMADLVGRDAELRRLVVVAEEHTWCGWRHFAGADEFADRPGQLAAQLRSYPRDLLTDPALLVLPMAALAAHEWPLLGEVLGLSARSRAAGSHPALEFFGRLAEEFCRMSLSFLRYGVLPELHGQNVLAVFRDGVPERFILRDHDTVRLYPAWLAAARRPEPGYRIKPGARQSLRLASAESLLGYLQTLGFQVNLYGIADALARWSGVAESAFWSRMRDSVSGALLDLDLPEHVATLVEPALLRSSTWPGRRLLEPLLCRGNSTGVSMPAAVGEVPNPLLSASADPSPARSRR